MTARPDSWKTEPMPANVKRLPLTGFYSTDEYERLRRGLIPRDMDDRWFIFEDGGTLSFHRSWTGIWVFQVDLEPAADGYQIVAARVNNAVGGIDVWYDASLLRWLIQTLLLGYDHPFPLGAGRPDP